MITCKKCLKEIDETSVFCQYCGEKVSTEVEISAAVSQLQEGKRKKRSKKPFVIILSAIFAILLIGTVIFCETKIAAAKKLYDKNNYMAAYNLVRYIPSLGREDLIRIKIAYRAGMYYSLYDHSMYSVTSIPSEFSDSDKIFYRTAFWDLVHGLYINQTLIDDEDLNDIEIDECEDFMDLIYDGLQSTFSMSESEADAMMKQFRKADTITEKMDIADAWLDKNFF